MNLHGIASPLVGQVNPSVFGSVEVPTGYETAADGSRTAIYVTTDNVPLQVQAASGAVIRHLDGLNIQGVIREVWANGNIPGLDRTTESGGAILTFSGYVWHVVQVIETWDTAGWCHVAVLRHAVAA